MLAEDRRYVLYRNDKLKINMAKTIRDKCNRLWKEQHQLQEVDLWSYEKVEAVKVKHAQQMANLEKRSCSRDSILDLVPTNVEELLKYDLLLSFSIRFGMSGGDVAVTSAGETYFGRNKKTIEDFLCDFEMRRGIPRAARASLVTEEVTAIVEERWLTFLQQKEAFYKEIIRTNVQVYLELDKKLKSAHIAYNEENAQFLRLPSSDDLQPLILENILREESPLDIFWLKENIQRETQDLEFSLWKNSEDNNNSRGQRKILDKKMVANAKWRQVSDHYLSQIRFYEAGFSAVMHASVADVVFKSINTKYRIRLLLKAYMK
ncbi:hypothetical protein G6F56_006569 [Rhizopus delemar]|nr:hypothetical protein G6F56_006569 [Rhizopus delemar]